ncbi:MAG TPA: hypothetical protein VGL92_10380 [Acidimicrobiia bacterium]|jgi:hypothetical protein
MNDDIFDTARAFLQREGRLLERRLFATLFEGGPSAAVVDVLRGYQNPDGGFGHGLEPDKRCPDSLPIDVEVAFQNLITAGAREDDMVGRACDWLATVAAPDGAVPLSFPVMEPYPRAEHWSEWTYTPGFNPTAGLAGLLHHMGVDHPWLERATAWCWSALDQAVEQGGFPDDAHAMSEVLVFLEHVPDRARAETFVPRVGEWLPKLNWYRADPADPTYGVTPLHLAPTPASLWRRLFTDDVIEGHLDRLLRDQQDDGGWAITWEPPGVASTLEWRGIQTLWALRVLAAYRGLRPSS